MATHDDFYSSLVDEDGFKRKAGLTAYWYAARAGGIITDNGKRKQESTKRLSSTARMATTRTDGRIRKNSCLASSKGYRTASVYESVSLHQSLSSVNWGESRYIAPKRDF